MQEEVREQWNWDTLFWQNAQDSKKPAPKRPPILDLDL